RTVEIASEGESCHARVGEGHVGNSRALAVAEVEAAGAVDARVVDAVAVPVARDGPVGRVAVVEDARRLRSEVGADVPPPALHRAGSVDPGTAPVPWHREVADAAESCGARRRTGRVRVAEVPDALAVHTDRVGAIAVPIPDDGRVADVAERER